jgi:hypothetical protein
VEGPWRHTAPGPRRKLLHHPPAVVRYRLTVSADPTVMPSGVRGSLLLDRRPPHYRCPAVPGLDSYARAILMALVSSVSSLDDQLLGGWYCWCCTPLCPTGAANCIYQYCVCGPAHGGPCYCGLPGVVAGPVALPPQTGFGVPTSTPSCHLHLPALLADSSSSARPCCPSRYERNHNYGIAQCLLQQG